MPRRSPDDPDGPKNASRLHDSNRSKRLSDVVRTNDFYFYNTHSQRTAVNGSVN